jgi:hypothetical protein
MSTTEERSRALVWAGGFLVQVNRNRNLPLELRRQATVIARHFPTIEVVRRLPTHVELFVPGAGHVSRTELETWCNGLEHGPLKDSTRLRWPE